MERWSEPLSFADAQFKAVARTNMQAGVLPVLVRHGDNVRSIGTCFHIGNGLLVTAAHVVDHALDVENIPHRADLGVFYTRARSTSRPQQQEEATQADGWLDVNYVHMLEGADLALLQVQEPTEGDKPLLLTVKLSFRPPPVGSDTVAMGYTSYARGPAQPDFVGEIKATQGRVQEVFLDGQSVMKPFAFFQTDARYDGGMSGGPVFSETGPVIGAITSSLPAFGPEDTHTSYSSLLAPLLLMRIGDDAAAPDFLSLATDGYVSTDGSADGARAITRPDGRRSIWFPWSL